MRVRAATLLALLLISLNGCAATPASTPSPTTYDPSTFSGNDRAMWGLSFADKNGVDLWTPNQLEVARTWTEEFTKRACSLMDGGLGAKAAVSSLMEIGLAPGRKMSQKEATVMTAIAVHAYCPSHKDEFYSLMSANNITLRQTDWVPAKS